MYIMDMVQVKHFWCPLNEIVHKLLHVSDFKFGVFLLKQMVDDVMMTPNTLIVYRVSPNFLNVPILM